jgi:hypothetical protein
MKERWERERRERERERKEGGKREGGARGCMSAGETCCLPGTKRFRSRAHNVQTVAHISRL